MDSRENIAGTQPTSSDWDVLLPQNNGIGEFKNWAPEASTDASESSLDEPDADAFLNTSAENDEGLEVEPIMVNSHNINKTLNHGDTVILTSNVLDECWYPDIDDSRPDEMTVEERYEELRQRQQFLDSLEDYLRNPNSEDEWKFTGIDQTVAIFRELYLKQLEHEQQNPDDPQAHVAVKNAHDHLVELRTYQYLAADPEARRRDIAYDLTGLGQVIAMRDGRYESAFTEVDAQQIETRLNTILDRIPQREYASLAKLIGEDGRANDHFAAKTCKVVTKALGLKRRQLEFGTFDEADSKTYGNCRNLGKGRSLIKMNKAKTQDASQYASTFAHESLHAKQHQIQYAQRDQEAGKFYDYCFAYYVAPEFNYNQYTTQYTEKEAFYFGNEFSRRIDEAKATLPTTSGSPLNKLRNLIGR